MNQFKWLLCDLQTKLLGQYKQQEMVIIKYTKYTKLRQRHKINLTKSRLDNNFYINTFYKNVEISFFSISNIENIGNQNVECLL